MTWMSDVATAGWYHTVTEHTRSGTDGAAERVPEPHAG
jgi:hypothetical protein